MRMVIKMSRIVNEVENKVAEIRRILAKQTLDLSVDEYDVIFMALPALLECAETMNEFLFIRELGQRRGAADRDSLYSMALWQDANDAIDKLYGKNR